MRTAFASLTTVFTESYFFPWLKGKFGKEDPPMRAPDAKPVTALLLDGSLPPQAMVWEGS